MIAHAADGWFDLDKLKAEAGKWPGLEGMDLAIKVSCAEGFGWKGGGLWNWQEGYDPKPQERRHVVAVDFGMKQNILRCLSNHGCRVTVVPATAKAAAQNRPELKLTATK